MQTNFIRNYKIKEPGFPEVICDVFNPPLNKDTLRPAVIFLHGGGFVGGNKDQFLGAAAWLAFRSGVFCINVQYRTAMQSPAPAPTEDCFTVFRWLRNNHGRLKIDLNLTFVVGGSPGAAIGALAIMADKPDLLNCGLNDVPIWRPENIIFLNGIFDLEDFYFRNPKEQKHLRLYLGLEEYDEETARQFSPVIFCSRPVHAAFFHGDMDCVVPIVQCYIMRDKLESCGGQSEVRIFGGEGHAWFNRQEKLYDVLECMADYIEQRKEAEYIDGNSNTENVISGCNSKPLWPGSV